MAYITVHEAAEKWSLLERRVTALCRNGKIIGAKKEGKLWLIPDNAPKPLDGRTAAYAQQQKHEVLQAASAPRYSENSAYTHAVHAFENTYKKLPEHTEFTPYRVCPIGAHSDHQLGKITGFAIDKGIHIAYGPKMNGVIEIASLQFPKRAQWHVASTPPEKQDDWADHLRGATIALSSRYPLRVGLCAIIDGELPIGGLSSSAAVIITFLSALCKLNHIVLSPAELIEISKEAENHYVGVSCGKLDQSCEVYCRKEQLLYMDLQDDTYELIPHCIFFCIVHIKLRRLSFCNICIDSVYTGSKTSASLDICLFHYQYASVTLFSNRDGRKASCGSAADDEHIRF